MLSNKLSWTLEGWGPEVNANDTCIANKHDNNTQHTIHWHVDNIKALMLTLNMYPALSINLKMNLEKMISLLWGIGNYTTTLEWLWTTMNQEDQSRNTNKSPLPLRSPFVADKAQGAQLIASGYNNSAIKYGKQTP